MYISGIIVECYLTHTDGCNMSQKSCSCSGLFSSHHHSKVALVLPLHMQVIPGFSSLSCRHTSRYGASPSIPSYQKQERCCKKRFICIFSVPVMCESVPVGQMIHPFSSEIQGEWFSLWPWWIPGPKPMKGLYNPFRLQTMSPKMS